MKLTPAEDWVKSLYPHASRPDLLISEYRQIQANALRWAFELYSTCQASEILEMANQLHPLLEARSKRVTLADAERLAKECTGSDSIETISCCQCGQPPAFPTLAKEPWTCISCQNKA